MAGRPLSTGRAAAASYGRPPDVLDGSAARCRAPGEVARALISHRMAPARRRHPAVVRGASFGYSAPMNQTAAPLPVLQLGEFVLDERNARLTRDGTPLDIPPNAF